MTNIATTVRTRRMPLLAGMTLALAMGIALTLWAASPAAAFIDDTATETTPASGFQPTGEGFIDSAPAPSTPDTHDPGHQAAPVGGVSAGFGGMAADGPGLGALHALAAGLLALVAFGLGAHRRRVRVSPR